MTHHSGSGPRYRLEVAQAFHHGLRAGGVTFAVYIPDSLLDPIERYLDDDPDIQTVVCTREDEGIAIAMGAYLGGKLGVALMEGSGLGLSGLILARGLLQRTPLLLIASHDRALGEQFDYHGATRMVAQATLEGLGIPSVTIHSLEMVETAVREALLTVRGQRIPVGLIVPRHLMIQSV
jgi:sulfopyruvate decarboxylase TPP-binding subunit